MSFVHQHATAEAQMFAFEDDSFVFGDTFDFKFNLNELSPLAPDTVLALQARAYDISDYSEKLQDHDHIIKLEASPPVAQPRTSKSQGARPRQSRKRKLKNNGRPNGVPTVKPPRKLNKAKIEELRAQIDVLQQQLAELQERSHQRYAQALADAKSGRLLKSKSKWFTKTAVEYKKLQKSKALNQKLKASLSKLAQANTTLGTLFQNESTSEDLMVMQDSSSLPSAASGAKCLPSEAEDVAADMVRLYYDTDSILTEIQASSDTNAAFVTEHSMHDAALGKVFELKSSTPVLGSDFYMLGEFLWSYVTTTARNGESSIEAQPAPVETQNGTFDVQAVAFARKFDTPHRTVFTVASTVRVPGSDLVVHQHSWLVASDHSSVNEDAPDSPKSNGKATLLNTLHRLSIETTSSSANEKMASSTDQRLSADNLEHCVVEAMSNKIRERQQQVQTVLGML
ncbi:hypothetical protein FI667_g11705, partial [Globisporangium splendens]